MTRPKRPVIPELIDNVSGLNQLRDKTYAALAENEFKKKDLSKAINDMSFFREHMAAIRPKKTKKQNDGQMAAHNNMSKSMKKFLIETMRL